MGRYRALLVDIDGTLVCSERQQLDRPTAEALAALQRGGVAVALATGRTLIAARPEVMGGFVPNYYICINGAYVVTGAGETLYHSAMSQKQFDDVLSLADREACPLGFAFRESYYTYVLDEVYRPFYERVNGDMFSLRNGMDRRRHLRDLPCAAFGMIPPDKLHYFTDKALSLHVTSFDENVYDICQKGVTKATGTRHLLEAAGIDWNEVAAVGDGENDVELLEQAGLGIAMGGAPEHVKSHADAVTGTVLENGVIQVIRNYF